MKKRLKTRFCVLEAKTARLTLETDQPPFLGRLPGFFLLRVDVPRSRLTFWPCGANALFEVVSLYRGNM